MHLEKVQPFINKDVIKIFTGIRRSGKSTFLEIIKNDLLKEEVPEVNIVYYNFEDFNNQKLLNHKLLNQTINERTKDLNGKVYLFLDEVQEVNDWEQIVNLLRLNPKFDIYVTGINPNLLSPSFADHYVEFQIYPFSFSEFSELYLKQFPDKNNEEVFSEFLKLGGMPYLSKLNYDYELSKQYLVDFYFAVLVKDIIKKNRLRDVEFLEEILKFLIEKNGQLISANSIANHYKNKNRRVTVDTVLKYLKACENAHIIERINIEDVNGNKILKNKEKIYLADPGFQNTIDNQNNINQVLENIVLSELLKRDYTVTAGRVNENEVDFIAKKSNEKLYIQVSYLLASDDVINKEFIPLEKIKDNYPKYVLSMDKINFSRNGIIHRNIIDFLLDKNW